MALEYDSDDIGELDQLEGHPSLKGTATTDRFSKIMDQFLAVHNTQDHNHDSGHAYKSAAQTSSNPGELALEGPAPSGSTPQGPAAASKQLSSSAATEAEKAAAAASLARVCCPLSYGLLALLPVPGFYALVYSVESGRDGFEPVYTQDLPSIVSTFCKQVGTVIQVARK